MTFENTTLGPTAVTAHGEPVTAGAPMLGGDESACEDLRRAQLTVRGSGSQDRPA